MSENTESQPPSELREAHREASAPLAYARGLVTNEPVSPVQSVKAWLAFIFLVVVAIFAICLAVSSCWQFLDAQPPLQGIREFAAVVFFALLITVFSAAAALGAETQPSLKVVARTLCGLSIASCALMVIVGLIHMIRG